MEEGRIFPKLRSIAERTTIDLGAMNRWVECDEGR
jgi:hypothetical protein